MSKKIYMALDQGTTSSRTILFDQSGQVIASASEEFPCYYPKDGWVEQDPQDLIQTQLRTMLKALQVAKLSMDQVRSIGITNQRETTVAWNKDTGEPVGPAIVWQCRRTAKYCEELKSKGLDQEIREKTGLVLDAYFSGSKMRWILKNNSEAQSLLDQGKLAFGTVDSWLIYQLSGKVTHITDASNASRTMLYNIHENRWDNSLLDLFGIPRETLPQVVDSAGRLASTSDQVTFGHSVEICGIAGDQQSALFGQACFEPGMAKNTYGTGCFLLMNSGEKPLLSDNGLLTTVAWQLNGKTTYALEGSVFIAGAAIQWLRDGLGLVESAHETEEMAQSVSDNGGVYFVPAFVGLGTPHWDPTSRGTILGITRDTGRAHFARSALESIAFQTSDVLKAMAKDSGNNLKVLRVDGGASANGFLCQFQADILDCEVHRPKVVETTAMGAAMLAALGCGDFQNLEQIQELWGLESSFLPKISADARNKYSSSWEKAVERSKNWSQLEE